MLFNLNRHVEMVQRLRGAVWQAVAYPLIVAVALSLVMLFLSMVVIPQFHEIFDDFDTRQPLLTRWTISMTNWGPVVFGGLLVMLLALPVLVRVARALGVDAYVTDGLGL